MARITLAPVARPRGRARLRRAGVQHQQHGAGAGDRRGGERARSAGHHPGLARRARLRQRRDAAPHDGRADRNVSADSDLRASRPRQRPGHLRHRDPGQLHLGDDGRLAEERRQDAGRLDLQRRRHQAGRPTSPISAASRSRANSACSARSRPARATRRTATAPRATLSHDQLLTNPDEAVKFVRETKVDALAIAMGTSHGAYKFSRKPDRRHPGDERDRGDPPEAAEHPSRHARLVLGAAGPAGHHQRVRRQDAPDLWRADRGDPARHQARRAQDQHRHRQPHGDHRPDPQGADRSTRTNSIRASI